MSQLRAKGEFMARYVCSACGYVYDEEQEGISWDDLPEDWFCPGCGAEKSLFHRLDDDPNKRK
jgi:rubredoxin